MSKQKRRTRTFPYIVSGGQSYSEKTGEKLTTFPSQTEKGRQITVSEGHDPSPDGKYREGGPFYSVLARQYIGTRYVVLRNGGTNKNQKFVGNISLGAPDIDISNVGMQKIRSEDTSDLDQYGATAVAQCSPTNPVANLGTGLAEAMKEGIPSIPGIQGWKRRLEIIRAAGSEFLNAEFGWLPLLSEISDVSEAIRFHRTIIQQYERDANRQIRREFSFPVEHQNTESKVAGRAGFIGGSTGNWNFGEPGTITTSTEFTRRRWFNGAFTHPPLRSNDSLRAINSCASEADKLFGLSITPDLLWELTPWSWAVDYFTNVGDVMKNITAMRLYGLIMRYGYIMEETSKYIVRTIDRSALRYEDGRELFGGCPPSTTKITSKVRRPANPFGFGISDGDLSPLQLAILAAVGISLL